MVRAVLLPAALTTCGRSMMTGPSGATSTLYSDRSPWIRPSHKHACDLADQEAVVFARRLCRQFHLAQLRCRTAVGIGDQLHHQHAVEITVRLRHPHAAPR